ncbi:SDR family NAD(P)-dependent oxidoreductase [Brevibacillus parabrevis]|uniref:Short-chain dehydrogenase n=1 Tax=Brevibacillus parabrevis TaxID=54914 RepID=A0A4Y3PG62_BREPA|nr:SDR family NAD(P)-dependent oxidoreductase [Brevibacillus parabrevis]GEB32444.1 hypothetical protein BPA01_20240 [Brevibacillus parabrevis]
MKKRPIALITGSSSGFGMHASVALVKAGFYVIASMRDPQKRGPLDKLANLHIATEHMEVISLDVTSPPQIEQAIADIVDRHGRIDLLLNNAGCAYGGFSESLRLELDRTDRNPKAGSFEKRLTRAQQKGQPPSFRKWTGLSRQQWHLYVFSERIARSSHVCCKYSATP